MKKILLSLLFLVAGSVYAVVPTTITRSSYTKTNDTGVCLSSVSFITGVNVVAATNGGAIALYNSSWTTSANLLISSVSLTNVQSFNFGDMSVAGLCYTTTVNTNGVQILYKR